MSNQVIERPQLTPELDHPAGRQIVELLAAHNVPFELLRHPPCRTSEESRKARSAAGGGDVVGAKAILVKLTYKGGASEFDVFVLDGEARLDTKALRRHIDRFEEVRFATPEEMAEITGGIVPGAMPPFARPIFPGIEHLFVDRELAELAGPVGFNAASLEQSLILSAAAYVEAARPSAIFSFRK